jgi:ribosomal protein S11
MSILNFFKNSKQQLPFKSFSSHSQTTGVNKINNNLNYSVPTLHSVYKKYKSIGGLSSSNKFLLDFIKFKYSKLKPLNFKPKIPQQRKLFKMNSSWKQNKVSVYINLRKNNIFVTILDSNNKVIKTYSSGSCGVNKSLRKKSPSYFIVIKTTLRILNQYVKTHNNNFSFKLFFKGFKRFRRPLLHRFIYNKTLKKKCVGIYNIDFEPFNGCRAKKAKRLKGTRS